jgi:uncharacterized protein
LIHKWLIADHPVAGVKGALEELFGRPVDPIEMGAVRNPYLKASIEQSRQSVYVA